MLSLYIIDIIKNLHDKIKNHFLADTLSRNFLNKLSVSIYENYFELQETHVKSRSSFFSKQGNYYSNNSPASIV